MGRFDRKYWLAALLLVAGGLFALVGWPGPEGNVARKLDKEPEISVFIKETGERKTMPIEEYIQGVVAGEMYPDWPVEAYAAQAILARSFTMELLSRGGTKAETGTDISTDVEQAQAYNPQAITPTIKEAVERTRGEVMTYNNRYVRAWFHSYSGGQTATAKEGLTFKEEEPPYIKSVMVPENKHAPAEVKSWRAEFPLSDVQRALADRGVQGTIDGIQILEKGPTDRITKVEIVHSGGNKVVMDGTAFRLALGADKMKSTRVSKLEVDQDMLVIEGTGYGHGVGLSQWDAYMFAKEGKSPEEIVQFFFNDIEIQKLWD
ncbi:MAG: SpoIID/LytB domain-containing protein [Limnochordia bacterium]|nr:SpoIID/LytB domain-containing protein [Bacillota bacterium]